MQFEINKNTTWKMFQSTLLIFLIGCVIVPFGLVRIVLLYFLDWKFAHLQGSNMEIEFDRIEIGNYSESEFGDIKSRVRKFNRTTYALSIEGDVKIPLSNDIACKFSVSSSQGNEFKIIGSKQVDKLCTFLSQDKIAYEDIQKYSNIPPQGPCPIPAVI